MTRERAHYVTPSMRTPRHCSIASRSSLASPPRTSRRSTARPPEWPVVIPEAEELTEPRPLLAPLRSVLGHDSLVLRHALRVAIVTPERSGSPARFGLPRGYWVTITRSSSFSPTPVSRRSRPCSA